MIGRQVRGALNEKARSNRAEYFSVKLAQGEERVCGQTEM